MKKGSDLTLMRYTKANDACFVVKPSLVKEQELHKLYMSEGSQAIDQS